MKNQNILIIIGIVAIALTIWFFAFRPTSTNISQEQVPTTQSSLTPTAYQPVSPAPTVPPKMIAIEQTGVSGQSGTATFQKEGDQTKVSLSMVGKSFSSPQPAHIHVGECPKPGSVKYPLNNVINGKSETVIAVKIEDLFSMLPLAINVHKSTEEASIYTACGDLK